MLVDMDIEKDVYKKLIEYACSKSDAVMLVYRMDDLNDKERLLYEKAKQETKEVLKDYFISSRNGGNWIFNNVVEVVSGWGEHFYKNSPGFDDFFEIMYFKPSGKVKEFLLSVNSLYSGRFFNQYVEDLSFFKDGYCLLYSITHEKICWIAVETKEEYKYLKSIGIKFYEDKFIPTLKEDLYYEEYFK